MTLLSLNKSKEKMGKTNGETKGNTEFIGVKVARDFGKQGVFVGEIIALEYNSGDDAKDDPFYVVRYTDGDQEDLGGPERTVTCAAALSSDNHKGWWFSGLCGGMF